MTPSIQTFLGELYAIDPALREHEQELIPLIEELLRHDPATSPDETFVVQLRTKLREHAHTLSESPSLLSSMNKWFYALGGAVAVALILPVAYLGYQNGRSEDALYGAPLFSFQVEEAGEKAFGSLGNAVAQDQSARNEARPQSGGGGPATTSAMPPMAGGDVDMGKMIAPYPSTEYTYVYNGSITDLQDKVAVYKRSIKSSNISLTTFLSKMNLGNINLGSFDNANLDNLSFTQNVPFGYQIYVNLRDGSVSVNSNWEQWPQSRCQTEECYQRERVQMSDVPTDDVLIGIARDFVNTYGIDLTHYGEPVVDNAWRATYAATPDKNLAYVPDSQRVVFPLLIDGKPVHDQGGSLMGISIGVHVKHKKVMDVWGIMDRTYEKSNYDGVTSEQQIKDYLSTVDRYPYHIMENVRGDSDAPDTKKITVELGAPVLSYAVFYMQTDTASNEVLVPSLIFSVKQTDGVYRQNIVVPLAKELLDQQVTQGQPMPIDGGPRPM